MIDTLFSNVDYGFLFGAVGLVLTIYALIVAWQHKSKKELSLLCWENENLLKKEDLKVDNLQLLFNGREVAQVNVIRIYLKNRGNTVVKQDDILNKFQIVLDKPIEILTLSFYSTNTFNKITSTVINSQLIEFAFDFFEPRDILKIEIQYSNVERVTGKIVGKVIGGNAFQGQFDHDSFEEQAYSMAYYSNDFNLVLMLFMLTALVVLFVLQKTLNIENPGLLFEEIVSEYRSFDLSPNLFIFSLILLLTATLPFWAARSLQLATKPYWLRMKEVKTWIKK